MWCSCPLNAPTHAPTHAPENRLKFSGVFCGFETLTLPGSGTSSTSRSPAGAGGMGLFCDSWRVRFPASGPLGGPGAACGVACSVTPHAKSQIQSMKSVKHDAWLSLRANMVIVAQPSEGSRMVCWSSSAMPPPRQVWSAFESRGTSAAQVLIEQSITAPMRPTQPTQRAGPASI